MKRILFTFLAIAGSAAGFSQVNKVPLIEHFTQASCGPCASQNPTLKANLDAFGTANYVRVSHQVSWPGVDPMNAAFPAGPEDRRSYYGITGVPNTSLNGGAPGSSTTVVTASTLASAAAQMTDYSISATQSWANANEVTVDIDVTNETGSPISAADKIYVVMMEEVVTYSSAPGSNGETEFEYVMREMYNASTGAGGATTGAALGTIAGNATTNFNFTLTSLPNYIADKNEILFAVYIQNNGTKEIEQAGKTAHVAIPGIISVSAGANSTAASSICDYDFTPQIDFTNNDASTNVTQVVAEYSIDAGTPVQQTFNGNLTNGQMTSITFPATTLNPGTSVVSYEIISVNGGQDWSSPLAVSMDDESYSKASASGVAAPVFEGFETATLESGTGYSRDISTGFFEDGGVASNSFGVVDGPAYSYGSHGGFGNSDRLVRARLFSIGAGTVMRLTMDKVNLGTDSELTFNHAYRQYAAENDRLEVHVSDDCGATWTSVFNEAGSSLATLSASTDAYNSPGAGDWEANTVDLSAFDGTDDVLVRFTITSAFGNNMFIDDINIGDAGSQPGASIVEDEKVSFKVFPNPANEQFVVSLGQDIDSEIQILDLQGKIVSTQVVSAGNTNVTINSSNLEAGVYTVLVKTENGVTAKKVTIQ